MSTRPEIRGTFGMVSTTHYLATAVGMAVLESGGNAVDAAVAAGFTLQVAEPHLNGPGGDMALLVAERGEVPQVLCGQGPAPARASMDHYRSLGLDLVPGSGHLAAAIPGSTLAWLTLLRDRGTRGLPELLAYAIGYAENGVPVLPSISRTIGGVADLFRQDWTTSAAVYLPNGEVPAPGSILANPTLARTYRRLAAAVGDTRESQIDAAISLWCNGFVAEAIEAFVRQPRLDSSGRRHAGVITGDDMSHWRPGYEEPATARFGDWTVYKSPAWGQGPVLLQQLRLLEQLGVRPGPGGGEAAELAHLQIEVSKLAFADREAWYGDSRPVPLDELLSDAYTASRARLIGESASMDLRPGSPGGREPSLALGIGRVLGNEPDATDGMGTVADEGTAAGLAAGTGEPTVGRDGRTRGDTCHIDVVDRWGGSVAATPSGGWLQSSPVVPELGFGLGTRLQMMALEPDLPSTLAPGRRPRTTLSPSMAGRGGQVELAFGTPGGDQQDQWQLGFLLRLLVGTHDLDLQRAIDGPSLHSTHFPSSFYPRESYPGQVVIEDRFPAPVREDLARRGHLLVSAGGWMLGRVCAVGRDPDTGWLRAGADPRGNQAYAAGR